MVARVIPVIRHGQLQHQLVQVVHTQAAAVVAKTAAEAVLRAEQAAAVMVVDKVLVLMVQPIQAAAQAEAVEVPGMVVQAVQELLL
jgi:hypothetical protein